MNITIGGLT